MSTVSVPTPRSGVRTRRFRRLARLGFAVNGVVHLLIGGLSLRVAFGALHSAAQLKELAANATAYHTDALAKAREEAKEAKKNGDDYGAAALDFAVGYHKAALAWLKSVPTR